MSGLISKNNFSSSTLEAFQKIDKNKDGNQDGNISIGELKKSITDEKGNISKEKLNSLGITNQKDIDVISKEYKAHKSEPKKILFQNFDPYSNLIPQVKPGPHPSTEYINQNKLISKPKKTIICDVEKSLDVVFKNNNLNPTKITSVQKTVNKTNFSSSQLGDISIIKDLLKTNPDKLNDTLKIIQNIKNKGDEKTLNIAINRILVAVINCNSEAIFSGKSSGLKTVINDNTVSEFSNEMIKLGNLNKKVELPKGVDTNLHPIDLLQLLSNSESPIIDNSSDESNRTYEILVKNPLKDGTSYVNRLRENLTNFSKTNMSPKDVLDCSLKATNNNYSLAVLSVHNLFKAISYEGRNKGVSSLGIDNLKIVAKLGNLRPENTKSNDKMGAWYHFFGVQVAYTQTDLGVTNTAVGWEHSIRKEPFKTIRDLLGISSKFTIMTGVSASSPIDKEKANLDQISLDIASRHFNNISYEAFKKKGFKFEIPHYR